MCMHHKFYDSRSFSWHNPFNENTIYFCRIVDWLSSYTPINFQQLSSRKFSLIWEINIAGKPSLKLSNPKLAFSNDHNFWSAQRNPTFFGVLERSRQGGPFDTTHSQFSHTTRERDHKNPHGLTTLKKKHSFLSENVTRKIYYHKTRDAYTYSQAKPTPLREFRPMLTGHHSSKLH
jgi:hypothetical protein